MPTQGGPDALTVALCTEACEDAGYPLASVKYGRECCAFTSGYAQTGFADPYRIASLQSAGILLQMAVCQRRMAAICPALVKPANHAKERSK